MKHRTQAALIVLAAIFASIALLASPVFAADKPNIILIVSDDFGYGDAGVYGGGPGRGMPTPSIGRLAEEGKLQPAATQGGAGKEGSFAH